MNFVALDVETANEDYSSICAIGLVSFAGGEETKAIYYLLDPEEHFSPINTSIHGITAADVDGKPKTRQVLPILARVLTGVTLAHHTAFDRVALARAASRHDVELPGARWIDTARLARRTWPEVARSGYGLRALADRFGITFQHHHALEDARACGLILLRAAEHRGESLDQCLAASLSRGINAPAQPQKMDGAADGPLFGETMVFTGALSLPRREAAAIAARAGCDIRDGVTAATTILVVGDQDIKGLAGFTKSSKHRKAEAMIGAGAKLRIITESDFRAICEFETTA